MVPLHEDVLPELVSNTASKITSKTTEKIVRKNTGQEAVKEGRGFTLFILNENIDDIYKVDESQGISGQLLEDTTEGIKRKTKKQKGGFPGARWNQ